MKSTFPDSRLSLSNRLGLGWCGPCGPGKITIISYFTVGIVVTIAINIIITISFLIIILIMINATRGHHLNHDHDHRHDNHEDHHQRQKRLKHFLVIHFPARPPLHMMFLRIMMMIILTVLKMTTTMTITCNGSGPVCGAGVGEVGRGAGRRVDGWNSSSIIA